MKSINEITAAIKFPDIVDYFNQPIKPGDIVLSNDYLYIITNYFDSKTKKPYITLIYLDIEKYYDFIILRKINISKFQEYKLVNINKIVPEQIKNIATAYFNLSKINNIKDLRNIKTKDIFT